MRAYIIRRLLWGIPILLGATLIVFIALHVVKGSPATSYLGKATTAADIAAFEADKGLDKSLVAQYGDYLKQVVTFDFGRSWRTDQRVGEIGGRAEHPASRHLNRRHAAPLIVGDQLRHDIRRIDIVRKALFQALQRQRFTGCEQQRLGNADMVAINAHQSVSSRRLRT